VSDLDTSLNWLDALKWDESGLITTIAQDATSGRVVMCAWMNRDALRETVASGNAVYWSRSRGRLWRKGEESGHFQKVLSIRADCDGDVLLLSIEQVGGIACHTGRESCFFLELQGERWVPADPVLKDPKAIYKSNSQ
jgi:phosphoribosyl-AMP cyclohydrolase